MKLTRIIILVAIITGFCACKKAYDLVPAAGLPSYLNVINSTQDTVNYFLNGTRQNNTTTIFPLGNTGYISVVTGSNNFDFRKNGLPTVLFSKTLALKDTTYQTVFVCGETADKAFITTDTLKSSITSAKIRFVNTADGAGSLDLALNDTLIARNYPFKKLGGFYNTAAGTKIFKVYVAGANTPVVTKTIALTTGTLYTLYVKGVPAGVGKAALTIGLFGK